MSANPYIVLAERRAEQRPVRVLFVGPSLAGVTRVFKRKDEPVSCAHQSDCEAALKQLKSEPFDCVMIDLRQPAASDALHVVSIAALGVVPKLTILSQPEDAEKYRSVPGVTEVLEAPVNPREILSAIVGAAEAVAEEEAAAAEANTQSQNTEEREEVPTREPETQQARPDVVVPAPAENDNGPVNKAFRSSVSLAAEADQTLWQTFLPLANFLYKKTAITILTGLFLTFLFYGVMIVFFMASSSWTLPFELSRGHTLVARAERDLGQMQVRKNQVVRGLTVAEAELTNAERNRRDAELVLSISSRTIDQELLEQVAIKHEIETHISRLKQVIADFNALNKSDGFATDLNSAYSRRLITKKSLHAGTLAVLETMHRIASVSNEVAVKTIERDRILRRIDFLKSLQAEIKQPEIRTLVSAGSDLVHLAREVIEAKNIIAVAEKAIQTAQAQTANLNDSLAVVTSNIASIESTPVGKAINAPVSVLFVPYTNLDNFKEGAPLYQCFFPIIFCSQAGTVGKIIDGETTATHPLFGKPLRGVFVEAIVGDSTSIKEEMLHVGRPPLFF